MELLPTVSELLDNLYDIVNEKANPRAFDSWYSLLEEEYEKTGLLITNLRGRKVNVFWLRTHLRMRYWYKRVGTVVSRSFVYDTNEWENNHYRVGRQNAKSV
jgi:hypothetical protein